MSGMITRTQPSTNILNPFTPDQMAASAQAGALIRSQGRWFFQPTYTTTVTPVYGQSLAINLPITAVGLATKLVVEVKTTVTNPNAGSTITRAPYGPWQTFSQISYTDPARNPRINTWGAHLGAVTTRRHRRVPGAAITTDSPSGFGAVLSPVSAPSTIANNTAGTVTCVYEIPLSFSPRTSFKGAVMMGTVFATQTLQVTFNPNFAQNSTDGLQAVYTGASNANPPTYSTTITLYQGFWDQFDYGLLAPLGPDLSYIYELNLTTMPNLTQGMDNYARFVNLREFHSLWIAYDNGGVLNAGTDITSFKLLSSNQTPLFWLDPTVHSYNTRNQFGDDFPAGTYMFDFSADPVVTAAEGNTLFAINPSSVSAGPPTPIIYTGWEDLGVGQVLTSAPAISGNAGVA